MIRGLLRDSRQAAPAFGASCVSAACLALALFACVDGPSGPGSQAPATVRVQVTLPLATPAAWSPIGETMYLSVRRAGRVDPIAETTFVIAGSLTATLTVPLAYATERFVASAEIRYGGVTLFLGFEPAQFRAGGDTALTLVTRYVGPGAKAASFELGARDSTLPALDTASLIRVVRDSAGLVIPNVPARFIAARPTVVAVDAAGILTAQGGTLDTARVTGYLPTGQSSALIVRVVGNPVASVAVSPSSDTIRTVGGQAQYSAVALDAAGAPVSDATFTWSVADAGVVSVDQNGLATAVGNGSTQITATSGSVSGSATIVVAVAPPPPPPPPPPPAAITRTWIGGDATAPTDWARAANWNPAGVPVAGDSVVIDNATNSPVLTGPVTVARLRILGDTLTLNGQKLTVTGDFSTENGLGAIAMMSPADTLRIQGNALFQGAFSALEDGVLFVGGHFEQRNTGGNTAAFQARNNHRTIFNGGAQQRLYVEGDVQFGHIEIANAGGVRAELEPQIEIEGTFKISTAVAFDGLDAVLDIEDTLALVAGSRLSTARVRLSGDMAVAGTLDVPLMVFNGEGKAIQPGLPYQAVEVEDSVHLTGPTAFAGYLNIMHGGNLTLNGQKLTVTSIDVGGPSGQGLREAQLTMVNAADSLIVSGDANFDSDTSGAMTAGVIVVGDDVTIRRARSFQAGGNHRLVLNGTGTQQLRMFQSSIRFGTIEVTNTTGPITIPVASSQELVEVTATGKLAIRTAVTVSGPDAFVDVGDSVVTAAGSSVTLGGLVMSGGIRIAGTMTLGQTEFAGTNQDVTQQITYRDVTVSGQARLVANTTFGGNTLVRGPQANLTLNGHRLSVGGNFTVGGVGVPEGTVTMTNVADSLVVMYDVVFAGAPSTGTLTAGTVVVARGFFGGEDAAAYQPSGTHRTVLNGAELQRVSFDQPGAAMSRFNHLVLANTAGGIWLESPVFVAGQLTNTLPTQLISGTSHHLLTVGGVNLSRLTLDTIPIAIGSGTFTKFDSVTFARQNRTGAQLSIAHPGAATPYTLTGLQFLTTPTTGYFVSATDVAPSDGNVLTLILDQTTPADGSSRTVTSGGAVVQWTGAPQPTWASMSGGLSYSCALRPNGAAYCWGSNFDGQLGDGTSMQRNVPTAVTGGLTFATIAAGGFHSCGLTAAGAAYCWGSNGYGELGDGTTNNTTAPVAVSGGFTFISLAAGDQHTCGVTTGGAARCWGRNGSGELGDGSTTDRSTPTAVAGGLTFTTVTVKSSHTCAITSAGAAHCWGRNFNGQLGDGTTSPFSSVPVAVSGGHVFGMIAAGSDHTCGVTTAGAAYCWGFNDYGQVGDGSATSRSTPVAVSGGLTFASVSIGGNGFTCGRTTAGAAYCWGVNNVGQLGDGTTTSRLTPVAVGGGLTFTSVDAGFAHVLGVVTNGSGYSWGGNTQGQLGDGTTTGRTSPVLVTPPAP